MMETSELYSLSNSIADDSSDKSDSSVGRHFDVHLCNYNDYGKTNEFSLNAVEKCNKEENSSEKLKDGQRENAGITSVTNTEDQKITMTTTNSLTTTTTITTTMTTPTRICFDDYIGDSSASDSSSMHHQIPSNRNKSKVFGLFSCNVECDHPADADATYIERDSSAKTALPLTPAQYKGKKFSNQQFRDELMLSLTRAELRQNANALQSLDKTNKDHHQQPHQQPHQQILHSFSINCQMKDPKTNLIKNYSNLPFDEMGKSDSSSVPLDHRTRDVIHAGNIAAFERLRGNSFLAENSTILERADLRGLQIQSSSRVPSHFDALTFERMRHSHFLSKDVTIDNHENTNLHPSLSRDALTTQMQQTHSQQQQQHQHQQTKSFTIDAILGLRNNQRDKHRGQQYRKHQGHEDSVGKSTSSNSCTSSGGGGGGGGKLKRVRTIFTAEQLERLEGEFARQQYMVGPERLYLAHSLRLTEAQVKVWFQNRRIKWRKLNHEQQSQRLHELHQRSLSSLEHEDSNETGEW